MRWLRVTLLVLLVLAGQIARADVQWRVIRTQHFIIYYSADREAEARQAGTTAEKWHGILSRKMNFRTVGITPVYLYPDRRTFADATGYEPGSSIVGLAHTRTYKVRVDASGAMADTEQIIPHELVHVFISRRLKGHAARLPLWMHEGLAKYWANDWSARDAELLTDTAASGHVLPLDKISKVFPTDDEGRSIAYVQSYSAVRYMSETYSPQAILDLFDELDKGLPFGAAMFNSLGHTPDQFEQNWREFLWEEYGMARWTKVISAVASAVMAFLAILAFRARLIKKRRKAREMEEEQPPMDADERGWEDE